MRVRYRPSYLIVPIVLISCLGSLPAQHAANANADYRQLRGLLPGGEVITVNNLELKRDAATFTFRSGSFAFYGQVDGKVTGAVFRGEGHLHITPPTPEERHNLSLTMHTEEFDEDFDRAVLRFTDSTAGELHKASAGSGQPDETSCATQQELQALSPPSRRRVLYRAIWHALLQEILRKPRSAPAPGRSQPCSRRLFHGRNPRQQEFSPFFILDPNGVDEVAPEEVALLAWDSADEAETIPLAFHRAAEYAAGTASGNEHNAAYKILSREPRRHHRQERLALERSHHSGARAAGRPRRRSARPLSHAARQPGQPPPTTPRSTGCRKRRTKTPISA